MIFSLIVNDFFPCGRGVKTQQVIDRVIDIVIDIIIDKVIDSLAFGKEVTFDFNFIKGLLN